jgi:hypothetical protein
MFFPIGSPERGKGGEDAIGKMECWLIIDQEWGGTPFRPPIFGTKMGGNRDLWQSFLGKNKSERIGGNAENAPGRAICGVRRRIFGAEGRFLRGEGGFLEMTGMICF